MAYCTKSDILDQVEETYLIQLTDDDRTGAVDNDRVDRAIADADAEINGYCGQRYGIPFDPVPVLVRKISVDIAIYNLHSRRSDSLPEERLQRYKAAVALLANISKGIVSLGEDDPSDPEIANSPQISSSTRIFSRTSLRGW